MVIRTNASEVGPSISQLVLDVRSMLQPDTAVRLKERRNNKLRDFTTMAGPLGVTHLVMFSRSKSGNVNCRVAVTPRGPTLGFRVEGYSLCKDVQGAQRRPRGGEKGLFLSAPLLVMNQFVTPDKEDGGKAEGRRVPKHLETLATTVFQSLFPPINPTSMPLKNMKRVLLMDRVQAENEKDSAFELNLRHYAISTRTPKSVPKPLRRLDAAQHTSHAGQKRKRDSLPNLSKLDDVADFLLDPHATDGFTSGSESEPETDAEVEVLAPTAQKVLNRRERERRKDTGAQPSRRDQETNGGNVEKKAIKLQELGPRLRLRLTKVEEGLCAGKVMWHEYIHKSPQEVREMEKVHEQKRQEKERRKAEQMANVERKRKERLANGGGEEGEDEDEEMEDGMDEWDDYESEMDDEDAEGGVEIGAGDEDQSMESEEDEEG
jgi:ribosome biogenesis protein SSF1/2